mmetsp:Transcript_20365/g.61368  ORF Transcript_20365/g.61368 Transcript_20365/m.61368 type:complete len:555 (-) Transcript_20365:1448-3112(-)
MAVAVGRNSKIARGVAVSCCTSVLTVVFTLLALYSFNAFEQSVQRQASSSVLKYVAVRVGGSDDGSVVSAAAAPGGSPGAPCASDSGQPQTTASAASLAAARSKIKYTFESVLEPDMLRRGIVTRGDELRARRLMHRLKNGEPINVVVVGGSITAGHGATPQYFNFGARFFHWMNDTFPHVGHTFNNGALSGTKSIYMSMCVKGHVPDFADVVLVEYDTNDGPPQDKIADDFGTRAWERLIRRLLDYPKRPLVIHLATYPTRTPDYLGSAEDYHGVVDTNYDVPRLSMRSAVIVAQKRGRSGWSVNDLMVPDGVHPINKGHQVLADLVSGFLLSVEAEMITRPVTAAELAEVDLPLMPPVYKDNYATNVQSCFEGQQFKSIVDAGQSAGFTWGHENGKYGFIGTEVGSYMRFTLNTTRENRVSEGDKDTVVVLSFLASYEHMGQIEVSCQKGCGCSRYNFDGHWELKETQLRHLNMKVTESPECLMEFKIKPETNSGEHKVKFAGIVISEEAGSENGMADQMINLNHIEVAQMAAKNPDVSKRIARPGNWQYNT